MLLEHYGLREQPFGVTPNPRFLYLSPSHREALASLVYGIEAGRGFLSLVAPPGMGKTTLLFQLLEQLGSGARTVFLFQSQGGSRDLLRHLMGDLGVAGAEGDLVALQASLNAILIDELQARRKFVLVVDEAQSLDDDALEFVRMLSNFETPREKLMQIILAGQPQLAEKLARPAMVQLRQRIAMLIRLRSLRPAETAAYVEHRLRVAGYGGPPLFTGGALAALAELSGGTPRSINNLCFNALSLAYATGRRTIDSKVMREVATELELADGALRATPNPAPGAADSASNRGPEGWAVLLDRILAAGPMAGEAAPAASADPELPWKQGAEPTIDGLPNRVVQ